MYLVSNRISWKLILDSFFTRVDDIGKSIVAAAKEIVIKQRIRSKTSWEENEKDGNGFQLRVDSRLRNLEDKIDGLEDKIDKILNAMTKVGNH